MKCHFNFVNIEGKIFPPKNLKLASSFPLHATLLLRAALNAVVNSLTTQPFTRLTRIKNEITSLFDFVVVYVYQEEEEEKTLYSLHISK